MNVTDVIEIIINVCKRCNKDIKEFWYTDELITVKLDKEVSFTVFYKFMNDKDIEKLVKEACTFKGLTK